MKNTKYGKNFKIFGILVIFLIAFLYYQNNAIEVTHIEYKNKKVLKEFNNFKIAHISDVHNKNFNKRLSKKIKKETPNIILITGDLIDRRRTNVKNAEIFLEEIKNVAPIYYVSGNHEMLSEEYKSLKDILFKNKVNILETDYLSYEMNGEKIGLLGINDPIKNGKSEIEFIEDQLDELNDKIDTNFNILLAHRPEYIDTYSKYDVDLVFSGHAHGGQIRIPKIGALAAPNQGLFPKWTEGIYNYKKRTSIVVSRGLGNSLFPFRIFNRPEVVIVKLKDNN